jgi:hypothetical protein
MRDVGVAVAIDAGGKDVHVMAALGQRPAQAMHRHNRPAVPNGGKVGRHDVKNLQ